MADKTSWTKPLARMANGDCIVGTAWLEAGTGGEAGGPQGSRPPGGGASALRDGAHEDGRAASRGPISTSAQSRAWPRPAGGRRDTRGTHLRCPRPCGYRRGERRRRANASQPSAPVPSSTPGCSDSNVESPLTGRRRSPRRGCEDASGSSGSDRRIVKLTLASADAGPALDTLGLSCVRAGSRRETPPAGSLPGRFLRVTHHSNATPPERPSVSPPSTDALKASLEPRGRPARAS